MKTTLLTPRIRVIVNYPGSPFKIGDILTLQNGLYRLDFQRLFSDLEKYPAVFQPLKWWEYRELHEMPQYVKGIKSGHTYKVEANFVKAMYSGKLMGFIVEYNQWHEYDLFLPATESDYLEFKNKTK